MSQDMTPRPGDLPAATGPVARTTPSQRAPARPPTPRPTRPRHRPTDPRRCRRCRPGPGPGAYQAWQPGPRPRPPGLVGTPARSAPVRTRTPGTGDQPGGSRGRAAPGRPPDLERRASGTATAGAPRRHRRPSPAGATVSGYPGPTPDRATAAGHGHPATGQPAASPPKGRRTIRDRGHHRGARPARRLRRRHVGRRGS